MRNRRDRCHPGSRAQSDHALKVEARRAGRIRGLDLGMRDSCRCLGRHFGCAKRAGDREAGRSRRAPGPVLGPGMSHSPPGADRAKAGDPQEAHSPRALGPGTHHGANHRSHSCCYPSGRAPDPGTVAIPDRGCPARHSPRYGGPCRRGGHLGHVLHVVPCVADAARARDEHRH